MVARHTTLDRGRGMRQLAGLDNPTFLTPPTFWVSVAVAMLVGIAIGMGIAFGIARSRALTPATTLEDADGALLMPHELRRALNRDEFVLHYQPKIELGTGRVNCLEALLRWRHPERGLLAPAEFLSVAEQDPELIDPLTSWVLRRALADYTAWTAAGHDWTVAVNLSARNLGSLEFAGTVGQILQDAGVRPDRLNLEVSELDFAFDPEQAGQVIGALAAQGIFSSIDDFGLGYTTLSQLQALKVSEVKIDQSFVVDLPGNEHQCARVRSLIDLGHSIGCLVTAEGVEWQEVADWLVFAGCDQAQGYLWLRPRAWTEVAQVFGAVDAKY